MWQDPWQARWAARQARRQARWQARMMRGRGGYGYRRRGGSFFGTLIAIFILIWIFSHVWAWLVGAIVLGIIVAALAGAFRSGMFNSWLGQGSQTFQQQPPPNQPYYQPQPQQQNQPYYQPQDQPYSSYNQGYQPPPESAQPAANTPYYQPSQPAPAQDQYDAPHAQYPEQMPPMQQ